MNNINKKLTSNKIVEFYNDYFEKKDKIFGIINLCKDKIWYYLDFKWKTFAYKWFDKQIIDVRIYNWNYDNIVVMNKEIIDCILKNNLSKHSYHYSWMHDSWWMSIDIWITNDNWLTTEQRIVWALLWINDFIWKRSYDINNKKYKNL